MRAVTPAPPGVEICASKTRGCTRVAYFISPLHPSLKSVHVYAYMVKLSATPADRRKGGGKCTVERKKGPAGRRRSAASEEALHGIEGGALSQRGELLQAVEEVSTGLERTARRLEVVRVR